MPQNKPPETYGQEVHAGIEWIKDRYEKLLELYESFSETASTLGDAADTLDSQVLRDIVDSVNGFGDRWLWQGKKNISDSVTDLLELIESETSDFIEQEAEGEVSYEDDILKHGTRNEFCKWFDDTLGWINKLRAPLDGLRSDVQDTIYASQSDLESAAGDLNSSVVSKFIKQANEIEDYAEESNFDGTLDEMVENINAWIEEEQERLAQDDPEDEE